MKFYYYAILSITYLWGAVVAHRDASMRRMDGLETGEFSVAILGFDNFAPGKFCNVNGGKGNVAGFNLGLSNNDYAIIGGGVENIAIPKFSTITGGRDNLIESEVKKHSTISGGDSNVISDGFISSVITGGTENRMLGSGARNACTISGGENNRCSTEYGVATGGVQIMANNVAAVAFGGADNIGNGLSATSVGGELNSINGDFSIGLGIGTEVNNDSSMVISLNVPPPSDSDDAFSDSSSRFLSDVKGSNTDVDGQFLVNAKSYSFQIGKNRDGLSSFQITEDNIQNLIDALENAA